MPRSAMNGLILACAISITGRAEPILTPPVPELRVTQFAAGLNFPTSMTVLGDGSLLVGTTMPSSGSGFATYYLGSGALVRLTDTSNSGVADSPGTVVAAGLPGAITSVRQAGGFIAVATAGNQTFGGLGMADITFFKPGATPTSPYTSVGAINIAFPTFDAAVNVALDTRPTPGSPGSHDVFFSLGAGNTKGIPVGNVALTGLTTASLPAGSLYKLTVNTSGAAPTVSSLSQVASGIRNSGGVLVDPGSGGVYLGDNGYETGAVQTSADELNLLTAAQIASGNVIALGYPDSYPDYATGNFVGGTGVPPIAAFLAQSGAESFGLGELAFAPSAFPAGLNEGIFGGFYGDFNTAGPNNQTNPVLYVNRTNGVYSYFIAGGQTGIGHLTGLASTSTKLYLADLSSMNGFTAGAGKIYEISAVPEPGTLGLLGLSLTALACRRRLRGWSTSLRSSTAGKTAVREAPARSSGSK